MIKRLTIAKGGFAVATAAMTLAGLFVAPQAASAQQTAYDSRTGAYYDPCARDKTNREVAGGLLGAIGGAVIGSNLARGGGRTGGAVIGGAVGAAAGAGIGGATAACNSDPGYAEAANAPPPPPPPPPPPGYDDRGYGNPGYDDPGPGYRRGCAMVESRVYFPDGTIERDQVRACRDYDGHWRVTE